MRRLRLVVVSLVVALAGAGAAGAPIAAADPLTSVAGTGVGAFGGDGGPATSAQLFFPVGVGSATGGGYLIADQVNNRVRRVAVDGTITTVAGDRHRRVLGRRRPGDGGAAERAVRRGPDRGRRRS